MTGDGDAFEVLGDLSPAELARRLAWPPRLARELIDEGAVSRTEAGWRIDSTALSRRWALAQWNPPSGPDDVAPSPPDTDEHTDGES